MEHPYIHSGIAWRTNQKKDMLFVDIEVVTEGQEYAWCW
jgi:hypothetical protein